MPSGAWPCRPGTAPAILVRHSRIHTKGKSMWWLIGGLVVVCAGLGGVIARRGGSMGSTDIDGHARAAAETIGSKNNEGQGF